MKIRNTLVIFLIGMLTCVPMRIYQILTLSDYSGNGGSDSSVLSWVLTAVLCICAVAMLAMSLSAREFPRYSPRKKSVFMGVISVLTAVAVGYSCALELKDVFDAAAGSAVQGAAQYAAIVSHTLGVVCVISFLFLAASFFRADNLLESSPALMLLPILWMGLKMTLAFLESMTIGGIAERKYDILTMVFFLLYFLSFGKFMSGAAENSAKWCFGAGAPAALFAFCTTIPRYVLLFAVSFGSVSVEIDASYAPELADLVLGVFATGSLFYISARRPVKRAAAPVQRREEVRMPIPVPTYAGNTPTARFAPPPARISAYQSRPVGMNPTTAYGSNNYDVSRFGASAYDTGSTYNNVVASNSDTSTTDRLTSRGAGMRVADDFVVQTGSDRGGRHGGLGDFRSSIRGGRRALDVLESSNTRSLPGYKPLLVAQADENEEELEKVVAEQNQQLEELNDEVSMSLSSLLANKPAPEVVANIEAAPDEAVPEQQEEVAAPTIPDMQMQDYPSAPRSVKLGTGLADKIGEQVPVQQASEEPQMRMDVPMQQEIAGDYREQGGYFDAYTSDYGMYGDPNAQYNNGYADPYTGGYDGYSGYDNGEYGEYGEYDYEYLAPGDPGYSEYDNGYQQPYQGEYYDPYGGYNNGYDGEYYGEDEYYAESYGDEYSDGYQDGYDQGYGDPYSGDQGYYQDGGYDPYGQPYEQGYDDPYSQQYDQQYDPNAYYGY